MYLDNPKLFIDSINSDTRPFLILKMPYNSEQNFPLITHKRLDWHFAYQRFIFVVYRKILSFFQFVKNVLMSFPN